jgi:hypothetical protein
MQQASPSPGCRTYVVGCDVRQDIRVFSGIPYHLAQLGAEDGLLIGMTRCTSGVRRGPSCSTWMFQEILSLIARLRAPPAPARGALGVRCEG